MKKLTQKLLFKAVLLIVILNVNSAHGQCVPGKSPGANLVTNGDFSAGNTSFTTGYTYCNLSNCLYPLANNGYSVVSDASISHVSFVGVDHTGSGGNFMVVNGGISAPIWSQTINVTPNTTYIYTTWVSTMIAFTFADLDFSINSSSVGTITAPSTTGTWIEFSAVWNSGSNTTATITITDLNTAANGNDFGLDDIGLQACSCNPVVADAGQDVSICSGVSTNLSSSNGTAYSWSSSTGTGLSCTTCQSPIADPTTTTDYYLQLSNAAGCIGKDTVTVTVVPTPIANAGTDISICSGISANLSSTGSNGTSYLWSSSTGTGLSCSNCQNPVANPLGTTDYYLQVSNGTCIAKDTITITVNSTPVANFSITSDECTVNYNNLSTGAASYEWNFGEGTPVSNEATPSHLYAHAGTYNVMLTATSNEGCSNSFSLSNQINGDVSTLFVPNTFTPNGDGVNDIFKVGSTALTDFEGTIFNRWGEKIYSWNDNKNGWDGTKNGQALSEGTYVYVIKAKSQCNETVYENRGVVMLMK